MLFRSDAIDARELQALKARQLLRAAERRRALTHANHATAAHLLVAAAAAADDMTAAAQASANPATSTLDMADTAAAAADAAAADAAAAEAKAADAAAAAAVAVAARIRAAVPSAREHIARATAVALDNIPAPEAAAVSAAASASVAGADAEAAAAASAAAFAAAAALPASAAEDAGEIAALVRAQAARGARVTAARRLRRARVADMAADAEALAGLDYLMSPQVERIVLEGERAAKQQAKQQAQMAAAQGQPQPPAPKPVRGPEEVALAEAEEEELATLLLGNDLRRDTEEQAAALATAVRAAGGVTPAPATLRRGGPSGWKGPTKEEIDFVAAKMQRVFVQRRPLPAVTAADVAEAVRTQLRTAGELRRQQLAPYTVEDYRRDVTSHPNEAIQQMLREEYEIPNTPAPAASSGARVKAVSADSAPQKTAASGPKSLDDYLTDLGAPAPAATESTTTSSSTALVPAGAEADADLSLTDYAALSLDQRALYRARRAAAAAAELEAKDAAANAATAASTAAATVVPVPAPAAGPGSAPATAPAPAPAPAAAAPSKADGPQWRRAHEAAAVVAFAPTAASVVAAAAALHGTRACDLPAELAAPAAAAALAATGASAMRAVPLPAAVASAVLFATDDALDALPAAQRLAAARCVLHTAPADAAAAAATAASAATGEEAARAHLLRVWRVLDLSAAQVAALTATSASALSSASSSSAETDAAALAASAAAMRALALARLDAAYLLQDPRQAVEAFWAAYQLPFHALALPTATQLALLPYAAYLGVWPAVRVLGRAVAAAEPEALEALAAAAADAAAHTDGGATAGSVLAAGVGDVRLLLRLASHFDPREWGPATVVDGQEPYQVRPCRLRLNWLLYSFKNIISIIQTSFIVFHPSAFYDISTLTTAFVFLSFFVIYSRSSPPRLWPRRRTAARRTPPGWLARGPRATSQRARSCCPARRSGPRRPTRCSRAWPRSASCSRRAPPRRARPRPRAQPRGARSRPW